MDIICNYAWKAWKMYIYIGINQDKFALLCEFIVTYILILGRKKRR